MFIINITYKSHLKKIDQFLSEHIEYLNKQYDLGYFIASGKKKPRTGGIIFSKIKSKLDLEKIIEDDPFKIQNLADYELIEFIPNKSNKQLEYLIE